MKDTEQRAAAKHFAEAWSGKGYEKSDRHPFWLSLLRDVFGVEHPEEFVSFEERVILDHASFIDVLIPSTHVLIEQKGIDNDLRRPIRQSDGTLLIYSSERPIIANNINAYLLDADNVFVESRNKPICDVPAMSLGNQPIDGGFYSFTEEEMEKFIAAEPASEKYFRKWIGSREFINRIPRYFLYLRECNPAELRQMPLCLDRVEAVRQSRLASSRAVTRQLAETPREFAFTNISKSTYIVVPEVSSERRKYIPMGFMTPDILCSNLVKMVPNASLYHFGVLTSNVHNAWVRAVCGRLKSDYRYSNTVVYNNFPWPTPTDEQKAKIEKTAQAILDARALYPDCSLADLYDEVAMPSELRRAHQQNDRAVMEAYGFPVKNDFTESMCVAELMRMYLKLTKNQ